jgi:hypothetical protein
MTTNKSQKAAIRARMSKTGESYTTARHYLLDLHRTSSGSVAGNGATGEAAGTGDNGAETTPRTPAATLPPRVAEPGMSDAAVQKGTGKSWDEWFSLLDAWGGTARNHTEIARHVYEMYGVDGWWAQGVTVGYERARGMRALHERPDGFSVNASKTFPVPVTRLFAAFLEQGELERWLDGVALRPRTSQPNRSARFDIQPQGGILAVTFIARGDAKSSAQLQQERLPDEAAVETQRAIWKGQLNRLATYLAETG